MNTAYSGQVGFPQTIQDRMGANRLTDKKPSAIESRILAACDTVSKLCQTGLDLTRRVHSSADALVGAIPEQPEGAQTGPPESPVALDVLERRLNGLAGIIEGLGRAVDRVA